MPTSSSTTRIWFADIEPSLSGSFRRQDYADVGAVRLDVLDQDAALVLVHDLLHDRETQPRPLRLRGHVGLEDPAHDRLGDAGAVIANREQDTARAETRAHQDA